MKLIFTDSSVVPCDILKGLLECNGVKAVIKNERGSAGGSMGDPVPTMPSLAFAWPQVWVADHDYVTAAAIVAEMKDAQNSNEAPWKCKQCGETVDAEFAACWNCNEPKDE